MNRSVRHAAALVASSFLAGTAFATPYSGAVDNSQAGTITFTLNAPADSIHIAFQGGGSIDLGATAAGSVSVSRLAAGTFSITSTKAQTAGYQDPFQLTADGTLRSNPQQLSDNRTSLQFERSEGIAVNRNASNGINFGRIYATSTGNAAAGSGRPQNDGIYVLNPDYSDVLGQGNTASTAGISFVTTSASSPYRLALDGDGNVYISDWTDGNGTVFRASPNITDGANALLGNGGTAIFQANTTTNNHGSVGSVAVRGSPSQGNLEIYTVNEDINDAASVQSLYKYSLGSSTSGFSGLPTYIPTPSLKTPGVVTDNRIGPDGKLYFSQQRSVGAESGVIVLSSNGQKVLYDSLSDTARLGLDGNTVAGIQDIFRNVVTIAVSPDDRWLGVSTALTGFAYLVPLLDGVPDMANRVQLVSPSGNSNTGSDFDAAGNYYIANRSAEILRVFAPGGPNETTYNSNGTFTYRNEPDFNGSGSFSDTSKWLQGVIPNSTFAYYIVGNLSSGAQTLTIDTPATAARIRFAGGDYTVGGTATLSMGVGDPSVNVLEPRLIAETGTQLVTAPVVFGKNPGFVAYSGANLTVSNFTTLAGTLNFSKWGGGTVTLPTLTAGDLYVNAGTLVITPSSTATKLTSLTFYNSALTGLNGQVQLGTGRLVVDYTGTSPVANVRAAIGGGYANGAQTGNGLVSSAAVGGIGAKGLGYAEASDIYGGSLPATYQSQPIDATTILVRTTYLGDANLDGSVTSVDFGRLVAGYGTATGGIWYSGDFDYNGSVDTVDFARLVGNFGLTPLGAGAAPGSLVPEPIGFSILGIGAIALRRRAKQG